MAQVAPVMLRFQFQKWLTGSSESPLQMCHLNEPPFPETQEPAMENPYVAPLDFGSSFAIGQEQHAPLWTPSDWQNTYWTSGFRPLISTNFAERGIERSRESRRDVEAFLEVTLATIAPFP